MGAAEMLRYGSFFLLTSCSHPSAREPALSKESTFSENVNTPSESVHRSHLCTYFRTAILPINVNNITLTGWKTAIDQHGTSTETIFLLARLYANAQQLRCAESLSTPSP